MTLLRSRLSLRDIPRVAAAAWLQLLATLSGANRRDVGVLAMIRDRRGHLLLARTAYPPRIWNLPGGRIDRGETPEAAIAREVREETGLEVSVDRLLLVDVVRPDSVTFTFACTRVGGTLRPAAGEIARLRWMTAQEARRLPGNVRATIAWADAAGAGPQYRTRGAAQPWREAVRQRP